MKDLDDFCKEHQDISYNLDPLKRTEHEKLLSRCKERALYLIGYSDKTERDLRLKLEKSNKYSHEIIDEVIDFLKKYNYLDDERYAKNYVKIYKGKKSRREIEAKLYKKGLSSKDIENALEIIDYEAERDAMYYYISKKHKLLEDMESDERRKLYMSLGRRGFSYDLLREVFLFSTLVILDQKSWIYGVLVPLFCGKVLRIYHTHV